MSWHPHDIESVKTKLNKLTENESNIVSLYCEKTYEKFRDCIVDHRKGIYIRLHKKACGCNVIVKHVPHFVEMVQVK